jgi:uncharacterized phage infection (PIP) family protein YhgE
MLSNMWNGFVKLVIENAQIEVVLALLLFTLVLGIITVLSSIWIRPKLSEITKLQTDVSDLRATLTSFLSLDLNTKLNNLENSQTALKTDLNTLKDAKISETIAGLIARTSSLEASKESERSLQDEKYKNSQATVDRLMNEIRQLQRRSEVEIQRMLTENKYMLAVEQAGQNVDLAEIAEQLARLQPASHSAALDRLQKAKTRLEELQRQASGIQPTPIARE